MALRLSPCMHFDPYVHSGGHTRYLIDVILGDPGTRNNILTEGGLVSSIETATDPRRVAP